VGRNLLIHKDLHRKYCTIVLAELLVAVAIVGMLIALLVPAAQQHAKPQTEWNI
jgi:Tfp pilus assembly protein FimT